MMSAMPAVAIRRERSKSKEKISRPTTKRGRLAEYYHKKISRMGSLRPPVRTYSTATSPDSELPPELLVQIDPYEGRCSNVRRVLGYMSLFHTGCVLIVCGLIILFLSMSSIKADIQTMRAIGSFFVAFGALLCLLRTIFFKKPEPHLHVLRLRSSESFNARICAEQGQQQQQQQQQQHHHHHHHHNPRSPGFSSGITMDVIQELPTTPEVEGGTIREETEPSESGNNGYKLNSPLSMPNSESNGTDRSPSPLRPTSADKMLPRPDDEKSL